jgi:HAD superfamily hydrolase (TIGR01509 family)
VALVEFGDRSFDAGLVAFDKDGTLLDFGYMWGRLAVAWVEHLVAESAGPELRRDLYRSIGYEPQKQKTVPQSPMAIAATHQLQTIAAATLYRHGIPWPEAEDRSRRAFEAASALPLADLIRPTGDVAGLLARLQAAGVRVAIVTTDHRAETEESLCLMDIAHLVDDTVCGDDGLPAKPAPDMLQAICKRLGIVPARTAVVGDTEADLLMAGRAGAGLKVAVLTGAGEPALLHEQADVVLNSIDDIGEHPD